MVAIYIIVSIISGIGLLGKVQLLDRVLHLPMVATVSLIASGLCAPLFWRFALRNRRPIAILFVMGILASSLVVYPKVAALHSIGRGSDQADCIVVAAQKTSSLQWPYKRSFLWSGNPMSCGPGWVMLQSIFVRAAGYGINLIIFWSVALFFIARTIGTQKTLSFLALLAFAPGLWLCAWNGSDFLTFGISIAALTLLILRGNRYRPFFILIAAMVFQFRSPVAIMPGFLRKNVGFRTALMTGLIAIVFQVGFLMWDPLDYIESGPLYLIHKVLGASMSVGRPSVLIFYVSVSFVFGLCCALWVGKRIDPALSSLCFLMVFFGVPALLNLISKLRDMGAILPALGVWEGGVWLTACVPLAALLAVERGSAQIERRLG